MGNEHADGRLTSHEMRDQVQNKLRTILSSGDYLSLPDADAKYGYLANAFVDTVNKTENAEELNVVLEEWNELIFNSGLPKLTSSPFESERMLDEHKDRLKQANDNHTLFAAFDRFDSLTLSPEVYRSKKAATKASLDATLKFVHLNDEKKEARMPFIKRLARKILRLAPSTNYLNEKDTAE